MVYYAPFSRIHELIQEAADGRSESVGLVCENPRYVALADAEGVHIALQAVRCRKCVPCGKMRARLWMQRAVVEFCSSERTWWVTYTYRPGNEFLPYEEVKKAHKVLLKAHRFRFVCSEEEGETNGRKHFHVLYHGDHDLQRRHFEAVWKHGFVHARLARSAGLGAYLAKYAAKAGRIRASLHYGDQLRACHRVQPCLAQSVEAFLAGKSAVRLDGVAVTRWGVRLPAGYFTHPARYSEWEPPF